jgi:hypothetical protein
MPLDNLFGLDELTHQRLDPLLFMPDHVVRRQPSGGHQESLRGGLLHASLEPLYLDRRLLFASVYYLQELPVAGALGGLPIMVHEMSHALAIR